MPLRAVDIAYDNDKQNKPAVSQHLQNLLSASMKVLNSYTDSLKIAQEEKQKISGNYDGQVILTLPEMGVKILFADQELRQQYYDLRHRLFTEVDEAYRIKHPEHCLNWEDYDGSEIEDDRCGRVLVATNEEGKVVAGIRFLFCDWIKYTANEEPENDFTIKTFLQKVGLNPNAKYVELEDAVIEREYRNHAVMKGLFSILIEESKKLDCDYLIGISIKAASRNHKMLFNNLGCRMELMLNYPWIQQKNHGYETRYPVVAFFK
ncbi:MAG: hypothetical protein KA100_05760 [Rickettsiales bacterium]|nr:hypothetical protein [Rickettsiales bacterium]